MRRLILFLILALAAIVAFGGAEQFNSGATLAAGDSDGDGVPDASDNCLSVFNPDQANADGDGLGNACDTEGPLGNPDCKDFVDNDGDGFTDVADSDCAGGGGGDTDGDGVPDISDNCRLVPNPSQLDTDRDRVGDACDAFPLDPSESVDTDGDGIGNNADTDDDGDGQSDADEFTCRSDPLDARRLAADFDGDNSPDCVDPDDDNDGVLDGDDNCAFTSNAGQENNDGDAEGDACDADDDDDGVLDGDDNCAFTSNPGQENNDGDAEGDACDADDDNDGVADTADACPTGAIGAGADNDNDGCQDPEDPDDDNDGFADTEEITCGSDPFDELSLPDATGDFDSDGLSDCVDPDDDNDGLADADDPAPLDPDADDDSIIDGVDNCVVVENSRQTDKDGDGLGDRCDPDIDGDGILNAVDPDADGDGVATVDEAICGSSPIDSDAIPERVDGAFAEVDDDWNGATDEALPAGAVNHDCDGDGYTGATENHVFSNSGGRDQDPCGTNEWPADLWPNGPSFNRVDLNDVTSFVVPVRHLNTSPGDPGYSVRYDLVPGTGGATKNVNMQDLMSVILVKPPMFDGAKALFGPVCPWAP